MESAVFRIHLLNRHFLSSPRPDCYSSPSPSLLPFLLPLSLPLCRMYCRILMWAVRELVNLSQLYAAPLLPAQLVRPAGALLLSLCWQMNRGGFLLRYTLSPPTAVSSHPPLDHSCYSKDLIAELDQRGGMCDLLEWKGHTWPGNVVSIRSVRITLICVLNG